MVLMLLMLEQMLVLVYLQARVLQVMGW